MVLNRVVSKVVVAVLVLMALLGCSKPEMEASGVVAEPAKLEKRLVVVSIKPLYLLLKPLLADLAEVRLLSSSVSAHDYQMTVSDRQLLDRADLVVWVAPELESYLAKALSQKLESEQFQFVQTTGLYWPDQPQGHDHHGSDEGGHHGHDYHLWLNAKNTLTFINQLSYWLAHRWSELSHEPGRHRFAENLRQLDRSIQAASETVDGQLSAVKEQGFVVFHDAYGHLTQPLGMNQLGYIQLTPEHRSGARHLAHLQDELAAQKAVCVFTELGLEDKAARQMAQSLNLRLAQLDPLGVQSQSYPQLLEVMAETMAGCLAER